MSDEPSVVFLVQINDVYHIDFRADPAEPDSMILPRLATVLRRLRSHFSNERVRFCLPGDFLNPSCLSRFHSSAQMVDLLNEMGLNYASFGNHEFDYDKEHFTPKDLAERIAQSSFRWINSNFDFAPDVDMESGRLAEWVEISLSPAHTLVLFGLLYESQPDEFKNFGASTDPIERCRLLIRQYKDRYIARHGLFRPARATFAALTHQDMAEDKRLSDACPELRLLLGGHDHEELRKVIKTDNGCMIVKALHNARTVRVKCRRLDSEGSNRRPRERVGQLTAGCAPTPGADDHALSDEYRAYRGCGPAGVGQPINRLRYSRIQENDVRS
jgi:hypothetical protein